MSAICEDCAPVVFDRYGDGLEVRNDGVALCPLHAAAPALRAALAPIAEFLDGLERGAFAPGDCRKVLRLLEPARAALRAAKGETS